MTDIFDIAEGQLQGTVIISSAEYERLTDRDFWLDCLEAAGVDNWQGYDFAREMYEEDKSN